MAANEGWYQQWFANGWFPSVWFAPGDESHLLPEEIRSAPDGVAPDKNSKRGSQSEPTEEEKKHEEDRARYAKHIYSKDPEQANPVVDSVRPVRKDSRKSLASVIAGIDTTEEYDTEEEKIIAALLLAAL